MMQGGTWVVLVGMKKRNVQEVVWTRPREGREDSRMIPGFLNWVRGWMLVPETKTEGRR